MAQPDAGAMDKEAPLANGAHGFLASDGVRLAYLVDDFTDPWLGAPVLLMLHSANGRARRFYGMVPALARHFRVVRMDLRGHGASAVPPAEVPLSMARLTADVSEVLRHLGCGGAHVLGNSAGGYVAQHLAMEFPEQVRSLLLFGSTCGLKNTSRSRDADAITNSSAQEVFAATLDYHIDRAAVHPGLIEWFMAEAGVNNSAYVSRFIKLMGSMEWPEELHRIGCPTLVVIPGAEVESGKRSYAALLERIPDVTAVTYPGARHNICDTEPDRCAADALKFLAALDARRDAG